MARAIRWTIPFKSFLGKDCRVDIYDDDFSGNVTTLLGAENPFYYEEDNNKDILTEVRTKTGYISIVERTPGELDDIYATTILSRYVQAWYGTSLVFFGFIQTRTFDNRWTAEVSVKKFAVTSPLGLMDDVHFPTLTDFTPKTMAEVLDLGFQQMGITYELFWTPGSDAFLNSFSTPGLTLCPINEDHSYAAYNEEPVYKPRTLGFFIENICKLKGWCVREVSNRLLFTYPTYMGSTYTLYTLINGVRVATTAQMPGNNIIDLTSALTIAEDNAKISSLLPIKKIRYNRERLGKEYKQTWLPDSGVYTINGNDETYTPFHLTWNGDSFATVKPNDSGNLVITAANQGGTLKWCPYILPGTSQLYLKLASPEITQDIPITLSITIRSAIDGMPLKYWYLNHGTPSWSETSQAPTSCYINHETGNLAITSGSTIIDWFPPLNGLDSAIGMYYQIEVAIPAMLSIVRPYEIELYLKYRSLFYENIRYDYRLIKKYSYNNEGEEKEVECDIMDVSSYSNCIINNYVGDIVPASPEFLKTSQKRLACCYRYNQSMGESNYVMRLLIDGFTCTWRLIADKFELRDDLHQMTLHSSEVLDN